MEGKTEQGGQGRENRAGKTVEGGQGREAREERTGQGKQERKDMAGRTGHGGQGIPRVLCCVIGIVTNICDFGNIVFLLCDINHKN